jgi:hypothetical protein
VWPLFDDLYAAIARIRQEEVAPLLEAALRAREKAEGCDHEPDEADRCWYCMTCAAIAAAEGRDRG